MEGETSEEIEGLSILYPSHWQPNPTVPIPPLLAAGPQVQALLRQARELATAIAQRPVGAIHAWEGLGPQEGETRLVDAYPPSSRPS